MSNHAAISSSQAYASAGDNNQDYEIENDLIQGFNGLNLDTVRTAINESGIDRNRRVDPPPEEFPQLDTVSMSVGLGVAGETQTPNSTPHRIHRGTPVQGVISSSSTNVNQGESSGNPPPEHPPSTVPQHSASSVVSTDVSSEENDPPIPETGVTQAVTVPAPVGVDDTTVGEYGAQNQPPMPIMVGNVLPDPNEIIGQTAAAASLRDSGILDDLRMVDSDAIIMAGPYRVITGYTRKTVDVHTQIILAVCSRYYATLPTATYDQQVMYFLHYYLSCSRGPPAPLMEYNSILHSYQTASAEELDHIMCEIAALFIPVSLENADPLANILAPNQFTALLAEYQATYPEIVIVYNFVFQFVHGGLRCIQPIQSLMKDNHTLSLYINSISNGVERVRADHVMLGPRPANLPVFRPARPAAANIDTAPAARPAPQPVLRPTTGISSLGIGQTPRAGYPNRPNQLMPQGQPSPVHVERNTTDFRQSVEDVQALITRIETLEREVRAAAADRVELTNTLREMTERLNTMDLAFSANIQRYAQTDLEGRSMHNRTLLTPVDQNAQEIINTQVPRRGVQPAAASAVLERLQSYNSSVNAQSLLDETKRVLIDAGDTNFANLIVLESITNPLARRRLISKLRACGVRG